MTKKTNNVGKVLFVANVPSMIDSFNRDNIAILLDMGCDIAVACNFSNAHNSPASKIEKFKSDLDKWGVEYFDLPVPRKVSRMFDCLSAINILKNWLKNNPCKLIHCMAPFGGVVARLAAKDFRQSGTKVLYFAHGFHFYEGAPLVNRVFYYGMEKYLAKYTDVLVTINTEDYNIAKRKFNVGKVVYMPGVGINRKRIIEARVDKISKCKELGIPHDKKIILNVSELNKNKNIVAAITALSIMKYADSILVICGKGELLNELTDIVKKLGIEDRVYFLGYRTDVIEILKIADLFMFTSLREGFSIVTLEAMTAGLPVVCSDIRGPNGLIVNGEGGYLIKLPNTPEFAAKADIILSDDAKRTAMGKYNMERSKNFDISNISQMMRNLYKTMLAG